MLFARDKFWEVLKEKLKPVFPVFYIIVLIFLENSGKLYLKTFS